MAESYVPEAEHFEQNMAEQKLLYSTESGFSHVPDALPPRSISPKKSFKIVRWGIYLVLLAVPSVGILLANQSNPEATRDFIAKVDVAGLSSVGKAKLQRESAINQLPITQEEKEVLIKGAVFIGATRQMAELALGPPQSVRESGGDSILTYLPANDTATTTLYFKKNILSTAQRGSSTLLPPPE